MANPYETDLDRNEANFQALTPISFLQRAAQVFPDHTAIIHGASRTSYREFWRRSLCLADALAKRGIGICIGEPALRERPQRAFS